MYNGKRVQKPYCKTYVSLTMSSTKRPSKIAVLSQSHIKKDDCKTSPSIQQLMHKKGRHGIPHWKINERWSHGVWNRNTV